ncbi:YdcF family protein [Treponema sp. C6A8]|uniref:YdcF family protein n=1 Tax=Treponema sp. C6A8 TaxID=1410609 RepID=UPI00056F2FA3|nr:YdcF family protein [Treponema sp. C6A8]
MTEREAFIALLDTDEPQKSDAIILLEGDGFARYKKAVSLYKSGIAPLICFSGGFDDEKSGAFTYEKVKPLILEAGVPEKDLILEDKSKNTYEQAIEIMQLAQQNNWKRIVLVASHYHSYRAFLTFLCVQKLKFPDLIMDMAAVKDLDWYEETDWGRRIDLLASELDKIEVYQNKNNVASYAEGLEYLKWKKQKQERY